MVSFLGVAQRIYLAFGALLALLGAVVAFAFIGMSGLSQTFADYRMAALQSLAIEEMTEQLSAARLADLDFRLDPSPRAAAELGARIASLRQSDPERAALFAGDPDAAVALTDFQGTASLYQSAFASLTAYQAEIEALTAQMAEVGDRLRADSASALQAVSGNFNATGAAGFAVQHAILTQFEAERFLLTADPALLESTGAQAAAATARLVQLHDAVVSNSQKATANRMIADLEIYAGLTQEAGAALFARNSVMDTELDALGAQMQAAISEMLASVRVSQDSASAAAAAQADAAKSWVLMGGLAALVVGCLLALVIGGGLSATIKGLAARMRQLAEGDLDTPLADRERHEVGAMLEALAVFRDNGRAMAAMDAEREEMRRAAEAANGRRARVQAQVQAAVDAALDGDFSRRLEADNGDDELDALAEGVNRLMETVERGLGETGAVLSALADTDLTARVEGDYRGAFDALKRDTNAVAERFAEVIAGLAETAGSIRSATREILSGAEDLSDRTTRQAATIEETAAAMEQLAGTVTQTARKAGGALEKSRAAAKLGTRGEQAMGEVTSAMERIRAASRRVSDIIKLIDDIAFQTNLLALNASVEAARAGDAGRGFAVVAVEVRRLAQSAAKASSEVKGLIEQSGHEVAGGSARVQDAEATLVAIRQAVDENADLMEAIAAASREQAAAIEEVNGSVRQLDEMTQHNAALVEEINAALSQTESQARELDGTVEIFTLPGDRSEAEDLQAWADDREAGAWEPDALVRRA
ncbi:methyl-accepting chemotaxis protein [Pelagibacterium montanilacus]|uniref:methyl-accepting chemotaxis protein n=1 Tax=Pelagibacterium montanilacus TaxID=2185280 RepID=UPI0013DF0EB0|nr:methyl-accepting chemotaxis protein [Pelagibacterium montanilacus]